MKRPHEDSVKERNKIALFRQEMYKSDYQWCNNQRIEYLNDQLGSLLTNILAIKLENGKIIQKCKADPASAALVLEREPARLKRLQEKYKKELDARQNNKYNVNDMEIERAKEYPLWKFLNEKPGKRIPCPIHKGSDNNMALYSDGNGYCFVCNKSINSIGYLMNEGYSFMEAVKQLQ